MRMPVQPSTANDSTTTAVNANHNFLMRSLLAQGGGRRLRGSQAGEDERLADIGCVSGGSVRYKLAPCGEADCSFLNTLAPPSPRYRDWERPAQNGRHANHETALMSPIVPAPTLPLPRILIADDDRTSLLVIAAALKGEFDVIAVTSGAEVLARAGADIDLVLLDVLMPGLDGFEVCRRLKSNPATATIPVIFVTGVEDTVEEARGFTLGGVDYITKPIRPPIVRARVRTHMELKRARDLLEQLASVDPLTGVGNRRRFDAAIADEWRRTRRAGQWLSLAIVDVDHFKGFNDRYGHLAGDVCLQGVAASLVSSTRRAGDLVARYGGEEFGLILPEVEPAMMHGILRGRCCRAFQPRAPRRRSSPRTNR